MMKVKSAVDERSVDEILQMLEENYNLPRERDCDRVSIDEGFKRLREKIKEKEKEVQLRNGGEL